VFCLCVRCVPEIGSPSKTCPHGRRCVEGGGRGSVGCLGGDGEINMS